MFDRVRMSENEKRELEEFRRAGLSPRQIRALKAEAAMMREYIAWLEEL